MEVLIIFFTETTYVSPLRFNKSKDNFKSTLQLYYILQLQLLLLDRNLLYFNCLLDQKKINYSTIQLYSTLKKKEIQKKVQVVHLKMYTLIFELSKKRSKIEIF